MFFIVITTVDRRVQAWSEVPITIVPAGMSIVTVTTLPANIDRGMVLSADNTSVSPFTETASHAQVLESGEAEILELVREFDATPFANWRFQEQSLSVADNQSRALNYLGWGRPHIHNCAVRWKQAEATASATTRNNLSEALGHARGEFGIGGSTLVPWYINHGSENAADFNLWVTYRNQVWITQFEETTSSPNQFAPLRQVSLIVPNASYNYRNPFESLNM